MALRQNIATKSKLSSTLKSWLPILQSPLIDLEDSIKRMSDDNPCFELKSGFEAGEGIVENAHKHKKDFSQRNYQKNSMSDKIESLSIYEESLFEMLEAQILPPLFPTTKSQKIAKKIIQNLDENGFFNANYEEIIDELENEENSNICDGELDDEDFNILESMEFFDSKEINGKIQEIEKVRARFYNLEPSGIGAIDLIQSLEFQLLNSDLCGSDFDMAQNIIKDLQNHAKYKNHKNYTKVMNVIRKFRQLPNIEYQEDSTQIITDIIIVQEGNVIELQINDGFYPSIVINKPALKNVEQDAFFKGKIKEAKDLIDALEMRKATIRKIGLMIIEYQYDFFMGGDIKPMRLKDIASELNHSASTISRAISNKFLECNRGIFPLKSFFTTAIDGDTSNASIKDFLNDLIKNEDKTKPLSDIKILEFIENKFNLKMVRRTITKYRKQLGILGSNERKRMYEISL